MRLKAVGMPTPRRARPPSPRFAQLKVPERGMRACGQRARHAQAMELFARSRNRCQQRDDAVPRRLCFYLRWRLRGGIHACSAHMEATPASQPSRRIRRRSLDGLTARDVPSIAQRSQESGVHECWNLL
eukprot:256775-Chlamydomonas_euryale.AAC.3